MSNYYKYNFVSPESIFALVKEELKSYFDTGAVDDLLFPTYVNKCLRKLQKGSYPIVEELLFIEDFEARLPDNFNAVREAWMCGEINSSIYTNSNSLYLQNIVVLPHLDINVENCQTLNCKLEGVVTNTPIIPFSNFCEDSCNTSINLNNLDVVKINNTQVNSVRKMYILKPGNISAKKNCSVEYSSNLNTYGQHVLDRNFTPNSSSFTSFDIRDNKFVTNFREGVVHLLFYSLDYDNCRNQTVPDNYRILEYIEKFLKYKVFETLTNQVNDETFNQLQQKMIFAKQESDDTFIIASTEIKKQTVYKKQQSIQRQKNRFNQYKIR